MKKQLMVVVAIAGAMTVGSACEAAAGDVLYLNDQVFQTGFVECPLFRGRVKFNVMVRHAKDHMRGAIKHRKLTFKGASGQVIKDDATLQDYLLTGNRLINVIGGSCMFSDDIPVREIAPETSVMIAIPARVVVRNDDGSYAVRVEPGVLEHVMQIVPCE